MVPVIATSCGTPTMPTGTRRPNGSNGLPHRLFGADAFQHGVGPDPIGHVAIATPSSPRSSTMSVAPNSQASC